MGETLMWEAVAEYADGSSVRRLFPYSDCQDEGDQQYAIECWLIDYRADLTWMSVNCIWA